MQSKAPEGVLFDLDDTLIAYDAVADRSWRSVCERFMDDAASAAALFDAISRQRSWYWSDPDRHRRGRQNLEVARLEIVAAALASTGRQDRASAEQIALTYAVTRNRNVHLLPHAVETLEHFGDRGVPLVLVTNGTSEGQRHKIERFRLERYFKAILIEGEHGAGKPSTSIYAAALSAVGVSANGVWSVGDNLEWDVFAPQRLGMTGIWHDYASRGLPADAPQQPDRIIASVSELVLADRPGSGLLQR